MRGILLNYRKLGVYNAAGYQALIGAKAVNHKGRGQWPGIMSIALFLAASASADHTGAQQPAAPAPGVQVAPGVQIVPVVPGTAVAPVPAPSIAVPGVPGATLQPPPAAPSAPQAAPAAKPSVAEMSFLVASDINPDLSGRPSPVIVRTYELKSATAFNAADFFGMFDREKEVLGADLVARDEWALSPGNNRQALKNLQRDTRYVGVVAAFRDVDRARWRAATFVYPNQTSRLEITLRGNEVNINLH